MSCKDFIVHTIFLIDDKNFSKIKDTLISEHISFYFLSKEEVNKTIFAEKIYDYFKKVELKSGKSFDKIIERSFDIIDSIIKNGISKEQKPKKGQANVEKSRARKYYEKISIIIKNKNKLWSEVLDYYRISLCLYMSIINNNYKEINDFDYSINSLDTETIIKSLKKFLPDLNDRYSLNSSIFVILIVMIYYIKSQEMRGKN